MKTTNTLIKNKNFDYVFDFVLTEDNKYLIIMDEVFVNGNDGNSIGTIWDNTHIFNEIIENFLTKKSTLSESIKSKTLTSLNEIKWGKEEIRKWISEFKDDEKYPINEQEEVELTQDQEKVIPKGIFKAGVVPFLRWIRRKLYTWGGMAIDIVVSILAVKTNAIVWFIICLLDIYEIITGDYDPKSPERKNSPYLYLIGDLLSAVLTAAVGKMFSKSIPAGTKALTSPRMVQILNKLASQFPKIGGALKKSASVLQKKMSGGSFFSTVLNGIDKVLNGAYQFLVKLINPKVGGKAVLQGAGLATVAKGVEHVIGGDEKTTGTDSQYGEIYNILNNPSENENLNEGIFGSIFKSLAKLLPKTAVKLSTRKLLNLAINDILNTSGKVTKSLLKKNPNYVKAVSEMSDDICKTQLKKPFGKLDKIEKKQLVTLVNQRLQKESTRIFSTKISAITKSSAKRTTEIARLTGLQTAGTITRQETKLLSALIKKNNIAYRKFGELLNAESLFNSLPKITSKRLINITQQNSRTLFFGSGRGLVSKITSPFTWVFSKKGGLRVLTDTEIAKLPGLVRRVMIGKTVVGAAAGVGMTAAGVYILASKLFPDTELVVVDENNNDIGESIDEPNRSSAPIADCLQELVDGGVGVVQQNSDGDRGVVVIKTNIPEYDNSGGLVFYDSGNVVLLDGSKRGRWSCQSNKMNISEIFQELIGEQVTSDIFRNIDIQWEVPNIPQSDIHNDNKQEYYQERIPSEPQPQNAVQSQQPVVNNTPPPSNDTPAQEPEPKAEEKTYPEILKGLYRRSDTLIVYKGRELSPDEETYLQNHINQYYGSHLKTKERDKRYGIKIYFKKD
jgi:hypothetical protein